MATIMKGDRVKWVGASENVAKPGESGIVSHVEDGGAVIWVKFSSHASQICFPKELQLLQKWEDYAAGAPSKTIEEALQPLTSISSKGAKKNDSAKPDLAYIPLVALEAEAGAFAVGGAKYGPFNYLEGGFTTRRLMAALIRHAYKYLQGEEACPVDGQHHLGSVRATAAMILHLEAEGVLVDDRYHSKQKGAK